MTSDKADRLRRRAYRLEQKAQYKRDLAEYYSKKAAELRECDGNDDPNGPPEPPGNPGQDV